MRKFKFSILSALIATAIVALSLSYYQYYYGTGPIPVRPAEITEEPIILISRWVDTRKHYGSYLQFAIWKDGKVVWRPENDELDSVPLTSTVDPREVDHLFKALSMERLLDPRMQRFHCSMGGRYDVRVATTRGVVELASRRKDARENYNIIDTQTEEMFYGFFGPSGTPARFRDIKSDTKTWPDSYKRFITNWDIIQDFSRKLKTETGFPYNGPAPKGIFEHTQQK